jgi:hypothetical protein
MSGTASAIILKIYAGTFYKYTEAERIGNVDPRPFH